MACDRCQCPDICLARPEYCEWAAQDPPNPHLIRAGCDRSRIAAGLAPTPGAAVELRRSYPTLAAQAANLAGSLWDWAISGFPGASDEEQARRRAICAGCPEWEAADRRCRICGCLTDYKIRMKTEHCPIDKW